MLTLCQMNFNMKLPDRLMINEDDTVKTTSPVQFRPPPCFRGKIRVMHGRLSAAAEPSVLQ